MYSMTLKNASDENIVYAATTAATAATPAQWVAHGSIPALSRAIALSFKENKAKTARKGRITLMNPSVNSLCDNSCEIHNVLVDIDIVFPNVVSFTDRNDAISILASLFANTDFVASLKSAYAPA